MELLQENHLLRKCDFIWKAIANTLHLSELLLLNFDAFYLYSSKRNTYLNSSSGIILKWFTPGVKRKKCQWVQLVLNNVRQIFFSCCELLGRLWKTSAELLISITLNNLSHLYLTFHIHSPNICSPVPQQNLAESM